MNNMEIKVDRESLLERLENNREKHIEQYKEALRGYRVKCVEFFEEQLELAKQGRDFKTSFNGSKPTSYSDDYDLSVSMVRYHTGDTLTLNSNDARCFLEDKWNWTSGFSMSNVLYSGSSSTNGSSGSGGISGFSGQSIHFNKDEV